MKNIIEKRIAVMLMVSLLCNNMTGIKIFASENEKVEKSYYLDASLSEVEENDASNKCDEIVNEKSEKDEDNFNKRNENNEENAEVEEVEEEKELNENNEELSLDKVDVEEDELNIDSKGKEDIIDIAEASFSETNAEKEPSTNDIESEDFAEVNLSETEVVDEASISETNSEKELSTAYIESEDIIEASISEASIVNNEKIFVTATNSDVVNAFIKYNEGYRLTSNINIENTLYFIKGDIYYYENNVYQTTLDDDNKLKELNKKYASILEYAEDNDKKNSELINIDMNGYSINSNGVGIDIIKYNDKEIDASIMIFDSYLLISGNKNYINDDHKLIDSEEIKITDFSHI